MTAVQNGPGTLIISLDFELLWGVRDLLTVAQCRTRFNGVYLAVPALLDAFSGQQIHATWATVGMLFFESKAELLDNLPLRQPHYRRPELSPYFDFDVVGDNYQEDPYHFAPELIRMISECAGQEVGTHTFSHYYCLEEGQTEDEFRSDLEAALGAAKRRGILLKSIVFPRNQYSPAHLDICQDLGFTAYRGNPEDWFWRPSQRSREGFAKRAARLLNDHLSISASPCWKAGLASSLLNVKASRLLRPVQRVPALLDSLRLHRVKEDMRDAARTGRAYHLWWHPENFGEHLSENLKFLIAILEEFDRLRREEGMRSVNMAEFADMTQSAQESTVETRKSDVTC